MLDAAELVRNLSTVRVKVGGCTDIPDAHNLPSLSKFFDAVGKNLTLINHHALSVLYPPFDRNDMVTKVTTTTFTENDGSVVQYRETMHKHRDQNDPIGRIVHPDCDAETWCLTIGNAKDMFFNLSTDKRRLHITNHTLLRMSSIANGIASKAYHSVCNQENTCTIVFKARPCTDDQFRPLRTALECTENELNSVPPNAPPNFYDTVFPFRRNSTEGQALYKSWKDESTIAIAVQASHLIQAIRGWPALKRGTATRQANGNCGEASRKVQEANGWPSLKQGLETLKKLGNPNVDLAAQANRENNHLRLLSKGCVVKAENPIHVLCCKKCGQERVLPRYEIPDGRYLLSDCSNTKNCKGGAMRPPEYLDMKTLPTRDTPFMTAKKFHKSNPDSQEYLADKKRRDEAKKAKVRARKSALGKALNAAKKLKRS